VNNFYYSVCRSMNQWLNGTNNISVGTDERVILNAYPGHISLDRDTIAVQYYDQNYDDFVGRRVGSTSGRSSNVWMQIDCYSPPNNEGEPRQGANRKLADRVMDAFKGTQRIPVLSYGTAGTAIEGYAYVRQNSCMPMPVEEMEGWSRTKLDFRITAVDTDT
jgi:hypothetical protein